MNTNKLYLFYKYILGDGEGLESKMLVGCCLSHSDSFAHWQAKLMKLSFDTMESIQPFDNDSTMFKVTE